MANRGQFVAIAFATLMVLSMVTPIALAGQPSDASDQNSPPGQDNRLSVQDNLPGQESNGSETGEESTTEDPPSNASSIKLRLLAKQRLENATIRGGPDANDRLQERLDETFAYYQGPNRINSTQLFDDDTAVISRTKQASPSIANLLLESQARLSRTELRDANRTVAQLRGPNATFNVPRAENQLDQAHQQFERGEDHYDRDQPNAAISGYRHAFMRSHRLLDRIGRQTGPTVELTRREDPIRNGSANYTLSGSVFAVDSTKLSNLTVTLNGESQQVQLPATPNASTQVPFQTTIEVEERAATVEVEAEMLTDRGDRVVGSDSETLRLDGDGLPDRYEEEVLQSDPLDPDSDAGTTEVDEADNGTVDGLEDHDGDGLSTVAEHERGLDPLAADTDDDGVDDRDELLILQTDPNDEDTDDDGVLDGEEDPDGDDLTHAEEIQAGSHPNSTDGDRDGLSDPHEVDNGTEPLLADTDDDGLDDGEELELGTDPLDPDTDDDGVLDGNETYRTTTTNDSLGVNLAIHGNGAIADDVRIERNNDSWLDNDATANASVASVVDLETPRTFQQANVSFEYEGGPELNESDLAVFTFDEDLGTWVPLNSSVDAQNDTVRAETSHFSTFVVFQVSNWENSLQANTPPSERSGGDGEVSPLDITFVIDSSGSMSGNDPDGFRKTAARRFVGSLLDSDRAAVVDYDSSATVTQPLTGEFDAVNSSIEALDSSGGTDISAGVGAGVDHLVAQSNDSRARTMILLADGEGGSAVGQAQRAADENITIHTVGFGNAEEEELESIAVETGGNFHKVDSAEDLPEVFSRVAQNTTGGVDSDDDGLTDAQETGGMRLATGENVTTDPEAPDTDEDGLTDGREVGEYVSYDYSFAIGTNDISLDGSYYTTPSHPLDVDSDDDGVDDYDEREGWNVEVVNRSGEPYRWDTNETLEPGETRGTVEFTSDPWDADTDDDGLSDRTEQEATHTDPRSEVTYEITQVHQREIRNLVAAFRDSQGVGHPFEDEEEIRASLEMMGLLSPFSPGPDDIGALEDYRFTDRTDDFDFVWADNAESADYEVDPLGGFDFRALDGTRRTDTWLSNDYEVSDPDLDPWDPDTDDDGLTDGQEIRGLVGPRDRNEIGSNPPLEIEHLDTRADDPDSDSDGWWDGWIGVYDAGRSDDVILYQEHLRDEGNGVQGAEIVQEQIEYHHVTSAPSAGGVDIDGDGNREHSNVHLGERLLGSDPAGPNDVPNTDISVEIDHYHDADDALLPRNGWSDRIERNYRLYGLDLTARDHNTGVALGVDSRFGLADMAIINKYYKGINTDYYMFVADRAADSPVADNLNPGQTGISSEVPPVLDDLVEITDLTMVFTDAHRDSLDAVPDRLELTQDEKMRALTAKTAVHEIGHELSIGRADDNDKLIYFEEVYSGGSDDSTIEAVNTQDNTQVTVWSVMSSGHVSQQYIKPTDAKYTAFSIEELTTIDLPNE